MLKIQMLVACLALLSGTPASLSALSIPEIVSKAKPAVLKITAYDSTGKPLRFGTGFFISDDGELVTNRHVIEDASTVTAETASGASYACEGALLEPKDLDLVMLKFKARGVEKLVFGDASKITEGQKVVVIGNPEGLEGTISEGTGLDSGPLHLEHAKPDRHCMRLFKRPLRLFLNCSLLPQVGTDRFLGSTKEVAGK